MKQRINFTYLCFINAKNAKYRIRNKILAKVMKNLGMINTRMAQNQLLVGDRVVVPMSSKRLIQHHAIYIGNHKGENCFIENQIGLGVRTISLKDFFNGVNEITRIERFKPKKDYNRKALKRTALNKVGKRYDLLFYNCECFANHIQHGIVKSKQVYNALGIALIIYILFFSKRLDGNRNMK